jgi:hypothetical protein
MKLKKAATRPQIHTGLFSLICRIQKRRKICVFEGFHLPLKYIQKRIRIVPMATMDQGTGMYVYMSTHMPTPKEVTPKPVSMERRTRGTFIHNRPNAFDG